MEALSVHTTGLRPGDVLMCADLVDRVVSVSDLDGYLMRVNVERNGRPAFWFAGKRARHVVRRGPTNGYRVGSTAWIERNNYLATRTILEALIAGTMTSDEASAELHALDTDSASC